MIPSDITFDANATPPQWTDNGEQVIEKGTNIRIKIKGLRSEVDKMYAVGTMKEVTDALRSYSVSVLMRSRIILAPCRPRSPAPGYLLQHQAEEHGMRKHETLSCALVKANKQNGIRKSKAQGLTEKAL